MRKGLFWFIPVELGHKNSPSFDITSATQHVVDNPVDSVDIL